MNIGDYCDTDNTGKNEKRLFDGGSVKCYTKCANEDLIPNGASLDCTNDIFFNKKKRQDILKCLPGQEYHTGNDICYDKCPPGTIVDPTDMTKCIDNTVYKKSREARLANSLIAYDCHKEYGKDSGFDRIPILPTAGTTEIYNNQTGEKFPRWMCQNPNTGQIKEPYARLYQSGGGFNYPYKVYNCDANEYLSNNLCLKPCEPDLKIDPTDNTKCIKDKIVPRSFTSRSNYCDNFEIKQDGCYDFCPKDFAEDPADFKKCKTTSTSRRGTKSFNKTNNIINRPLRPINTDCGENFIKADKCYIECPNNTFISNEDNTKCIKNNILDRNYNGLPISTCADGYEKINDFCMEKCPIGSVSNFDNNEYNCSVNESKDRQIDPNITNNKQDFINYLNSQNIGCSEWNSPQTGQSNEIIESNFISGESFNVSNGTTNYNYDTTKPKIWVCKSTSPGFNTTFINITNWKKDQKIYDWSTGWTTKSFDKLPFYVEKKCQEGSELINGQCYRPCESGYTVDPTNKTKCIKKNITPRKIGTSTIKCEKGTLINYKCYDDCPSSYNIDPANSIKCKSQTETIDRPSKQVNFSCPDNTERIDNYCYDQCPQDFVINANNKKQCLQEKCNTGYKKDINGECIRDCPDTFKINPENSTECIKDCSKFPNDEFGKYILTQDKQDCKLECNDKSFIIKDNKCVKDCSTDKLTYPDFNGNYILEGTECLKQCDDGSILYNKISDEKYKSTKEKKDYQIKSYYNALEIYSTNKQVYDTSKLYGTPTMPEPIPPTRTDVFDKICVKDCNNKIAFPPKKNGYYELSIDEKECDFYCNNGFELINGECIKKCDSGFKLDPNDLTQSTCIKDCDKLTPDLNGKWENDKNDLQKCILVCNNDYLNDPENSSKCIPDCNKKILNNGKYVLNESKSACVEKCNNSFIFMNGQCIQDCNNETNYPKINNGNYILNKDLKCEIECNTDFINIENECLPNCSTKLIKNGKFVLKNKQCEIECNDGFINLDGKCIADCNNQNNYPAINGGKYVLSKDDDENCNIECDSGYLLQGYECIQDCSKLAPIQNGKYVLNNNKCEINCDNGYDLINNLCVMKEKNPAVEETLLKNTQETILGEEEGLIKSELSINQDNTKSELVSNQESAPESKQVLLSESESETVTSDLQKDLKQLPFVTQESNNLIKEEETEPSNLKWYIIGIILFALIVIGLIFLLKKK